MVEARRDCPIHRDERMGVWRPFVVPASQASTFFLRGLSRGEMFRTPDFDAGNLLFRLL